MQNAWANLLVDGAGMVEMAFYQVKSEDQDYSAKELMDSEKCFGF
jgi:hypothetical protein